MSPAFAEVNDAMQQFAGTNYVSSEQHKDSTEARIVRDMTDTEKLLSFLLQHNPFVREPSLRNIVTGVTAHPEVNAHESRMVGENILASMEGKLVGEYSFKKSQQVVSATMKIQGDDANVDPHLLSQRLVTVSSPSYHGYQLNPEYYGTHCLSNGTWDRN